MDESLPLHSMGALSPKRRASAPTSATGEMERAAAGRSQGRSHSGWRRSVMVGAGGQASMPTGQ